MPPRAWSPRDGVTVKYPEDPPKLRPGVVVDILSESAIVVLGTTKEHAEWGPGVCVQRGDPAFKRLGLTETTYFYPKYAIVAAFGALMPRGSRCDSETFEDLRDIAMRAQYQYRECMPHVGFGKATR